MTQPIDLNLSSRPFRNNTLPWIALVGSCLLLLGFTYWNTASYREHNRLLSEARDVKTSIAGQLVDLQNREKRALEFIRGYDVEALKVQTDKANEVIGWKAFSWTRLFNRMEVVQPWNVHMRSIQPLFRSGGSDRVGFFTDKSKSVMVAVEGVSKEINALFEFEQRLFEDSHFAQAEPEEYVLTSKGEAIFILRFRYYPKGRPGFEAEAMAVSQATGSDEAEGDASEQQAAAETPEATTEPAAGRELPRIQRPARSEAADQPAATDTTAAAGELGAEAPTVPASAVVEPVTTETEKAAPAAGPGPARKAGSARKSGANRSGNKRKGGQPQRIKRPGRSTDRSKEDDQSKEPPGDGDDTSEEQTP